MKVWGANEQEIRAAAKAVGVELFGWPNGHVSQDGRALRFRLSVDRTQPRGENGELPYQRISQSRMSGIRGRRIAAVCWHGHRDFMRALFRTNPEARIKTALADYRGSEDFERKFSGTYGNGNSYNLDYGQACTCLEHTREEWEAAA